MIRSKEVIIHKMFLYEIKAYTTHPLCPRLSDSYEIFPN